jgi:hypothetical protein
MEVEIGRITHYYNHLNVAVLSLTGELKVGDTIHILGHITDLTQPVGSLEVEHHKVVSVKPGDDVALKVGETVREHDKVYKIVEDIFEIHAT